MISEFYNVCILMQSSSSEVKELLISFVITDIIQRPKHYYMEKLQHVFYDRSSLRANLVNTNIFVPQPCLLDTEPFYKASLIFDRTDFIDILSAVTAEVDARHEQLQKFYQEISNDTTLMHPNISGPKPFMESCDAVDDIWEVVNNYSHYRDALHSVVIGRHRSPRDACFDIVTNELQKNGSHTMPHDGSPILTLEMVDKPDITVQRIMSAVRLNKLAAQGKYGPIPRTNWWTDEEVKPFHVLKKARFDGPPGFTNLDKIRQFVIDNAKICL